MYQIFDLKDAHAFCQKLALHIEQKPMGSRQREEIYFISNLFGPKSMGNRFLQDIISCVSLLLEINGYNRQN